MQSRATFGPAAAAALLLASIASVQAQHDDPMAPINKVVTLLQNLKTDIENDATAEQTSYDKYACWCETTTHEKAQATVAADAALLNWANEIVRLGVESSDEQDKIFSHQKDIAENKKSQAIATKLRGEQNAKYQQETSDLMNSMEAVGKALKVLHDTTKSMSLAQENTDSKLHATLLKAINTLPNEAVAKLPPAHLAQLRTVTAHLLSGKGKSGYAPQSATIQGIFSDMYGQFAKDLMDKTHDEAIANKLYEELMATRITAQITSEEQLLAAEKAKTEADKMLGESKEIYAETTEQKKRDIEFFNKVSASCTKKTGEFQARKALRDVELKGVEDCLTIMESTAAQDKFAAAIKPGQTTFLQLKSDNQRARPAMEKAYAALRERASESKSLRLASVAAQVRMAKAGHFDAVLGSIDAMLNTIALEQKADTQKYDECKAEYHSLASEKADLEWKIGNDDALIAKLTAIIGTLTTERDATTTAINELTATAQTLTVTRRTEHAAYLTELQLDKDSIGYLEDAKAVLAKYYKDNSTGLGVLELEQQPTTTTKAPEFAASSSRTTQAKVIVSMLTMIIQDLHAEINKANMDESSAEKDYQDLMAQSNTTHDELTDKRLSLNAAIDDREDEKTAAEGKKGTDETDHQNNADAKTAITTTCDDVLNNFQIRLQKRDKEEEGLTKAKAALVQFYEGGNAGLVYQSALVRRAFFSGIQSH